MSIPKIAALDHYAQEATESMHNAWDDDLSILERVIGLSEETGEVSAIVKKRLMRNGWDDFHLTEEDVDKLVDELGDVLFYVAAILDLIGIPLSRAASLNINKLKTRSR